MSNELTKFLEVAGLPVIDDSQLAAALSEAADAAITSGGGGKQGGTALAGIKKKLTQTSYT